MTSPETLQLNYELIDRLSPLPITHITRRSQPSRDPFFSPYVIDMQWAGSGARAGGAISLGYSNYIQGRIIRGISPNHIASGMQVYCYTSLRRNPFESLSAVLTAVCTINQLALAVGEDITHLVRANKLSQPFFERFRTSGLYYFSNFCGVQVYPKKTVDEYTMYAAHYPIDLLAQARRFAVPGAIEELLSMREELLEVSDLPSYQGRQEVT